MYSQALGDKGLEQRTKTSSSKNGDENFTIKLRLNEVAKRLYMDISETEWRTELGKEREKRDIHISMLICYSICIYISSVVYMYVYNIAYRYAIIQQNKIQVLESWVLWLAGENAQVNI